MLSRFSDFRYKEVINVRTGSRLGYVCDAEFTSPEGRITALIVPGRPRILGMFGRDEDYVLPWESISRIGDDIILVESEHAVRREKRPKRQGFAGKNT